VIAAAHTDSPVLKVKPHSKKSSEDYEELGVETYGGGLWYTWFDRDLSLAGRVIVEKSDDKFESHLVDIKRPILKIPSLAIHLNRDIGTEGFKPNPQTHLLPVLATSIKAQLSSEKKEEGSSEAHHPLLLELLAEELKIETSAIRDFELSLYDTQPATIGGAKNEFVFARGLDNQLSAFVLTRALIDGLTSLPNDKQIRMVILFDHEEIGSQSYHGAHSSFVPDVLQRINHDKKSYHGAIRKSILISADMAHAVHPNYPEKHEPLHKPKIHQGLVIKHNGSQRYATNAVTSFLITEIAKRHKIPIQRFSARNDMGCGTTIGPIVAAGAGIRTVDVGIPQLAMHSIREMCGTKDIETSHRLFVAFFEEFFALDSSLVVDK